MTALPTGARSEVVAFRGISGVRPLWWQPNLGTGRWHGQGQPRPVQYLSLHPMGPLAELARHLGLRSEADLREMRRNVFALRVRPLRLLDLDYPTAESLGLDPADLVGPPSSYPRCQALLDGLLESASPPDAMRVPSAALPGTANLVLLGPRHPLPYDREPRRAADVPCAVVALDARATVRLAAVLRPLEARDHPGLTAWRAGAALPFAQPRTAA